MIFRVFKIFRVFLEIFYHKNSNFSARKHRCFPIINPLFCHFYQNREKTHVLSNTQQPQKVREEQYQYRKKGKIGKKKKTHTLYI